MTEALVVKKKRWRISPVWFLPFTALLLAVWLAYESYTHRGVSVTIRFTTGSGISINKTKVMYKGIAIGKVTDIEINKKDIDQVIVTVLLDKRTRPFLLTDTKFWLVKPSVSLGGISGLDTLVSGNYIAMSPGFKGKPKLDYTALKEAPVEKNDKNSLYIHLIAKSRGSLAPSSPVYYKKIQVGEVIGSKYNKSTQDVTVMLRIEQEYADLVKKQSRFYNVSGIQVNGSLKGIKIKTESLASLVIGGIAFYNPENTYLDEQAEDNDSFPLFDDFESADIGIPIVLNLEDVSNLEEGSTEISYLGSKIGFIKKINTNYKTGKITATAYIIPRAAELLTSGTKMWKVKPVLSINQLTGVETLIKGVYLTIRPGKGLPSSVFHVLENPPALDVSEPGLHISLTAKQLGSLQVGSGVYFKNIKIGSVQAYLLDNADSSLSIQIFIQPDYVDLINQNTHFYKNSGISIKGGLSGVSIKAESLSSIISGGISVYNPETTMASDSIIKSKNGDNFKLYENYESASSGSEISLYFSDVSGIKKDATRVIYKGIDLGYVSLIQPDKKLGRIKVMARIDPVAKELLRKDTKFWLVKPKVSLSGVSGLDTLISGSYITLKPGGGEFSRTFNALDNAPQFVQANNGLELIIKAQELGSISVGAPVLYHQLPVGLITSYELDKKTDHINIKITIDEDYKKLVKNSSRFYQASGISITGGLSGLKLRTESLASVIKGGIAFINPPGSPDQSGKPAIVANNHQFVLFEDLQSARQDRFKVSVFFPDANGLKKGTKVKYNGLEVGELISLKLHNDLKQVIAELSIDSKLRKILGKESRFMLAKPVFGLSHTEHLATLVEGSFIILEPVAGKFSSHFYARESNLQKGLHLVLKAERLGSIKKDNPIYYRQVKVGRVIASELSQTADNVLIHILIEKKYAPLVRTNSKFWNASGINVDINLLSGSKIKTESLQSILDGGISFATPGGKTIINNALVKEEDDADISQVISKQSISKQTTSKQKLAKRAAPGTEFILHSEVNAKWLQWNPKISLK